jgi:hypothetical protein
MKDEEWILCSEHLPQKNGKYLCTTKGLTTSLQYEIGEWGRGCFVNWQGDTVEKDEDPHWFARWPVIAWMPLPKLYEE